MYRELCQYSYIIWCFSLSILVWWIEFLSWRFHYYWIEYFLDLRTLNVCLAYGYPWWQWGVLLIHLIYVWYSTCGLSWHWGNLCIGVDTRSRPSFFGRKLGALFEILCVGLNIMNLKLFDAYHIINPRMLVVTLEYLGDIRVDWCVSYGVILLQL